MDLEFISREAAYEWVYNLPDGPEKDAAANLVLEVYGEPDPEPVESKVEDRFLPYRFEPEKYIQDFLGWEPWSGTEENPGQVQIINAYTLALRQQFERRDFEKGELTESELKYWQPDQVIKNYIRVEAGHTTGKTKTESGLVNHFLDCFKSVIMMYGPSHDTLQDNLWQELLVDRRGKNLPGRILDSMQIRVGDNHYAKCRVTSDSHGKGSEKLQGKHGEFLMFVLDEAEGIPEFVFNAIDSMTSGGICIVLMVANPKTRTSKFHKMQGVSNCVSLRMSCLAHPNVIAGKEIVPGAVRRHYVEMMVEKHCDEVLEHSEKDQTFTLPYPIKVEGGKILPAGTIFRPKFEFMFRVLGVAPPNMSEKTVIPFGIYDAARKRKPSGNDPHIARMGVDCARWGIDNGTLYLRHAGAIKKLAEFPQQKSRVYFQTIKTEALKLKAKGVTSLHIRFDGGGGFASGPVDLLKEDEELRKAFKEFKVFEIQFGAKAIDGTKYADLITQLYFEMAEVLQGLAVVNPPDILEIELTEREYDYITRKEKSLKKLEAKDDYKDRKKTKSPDDADGCILAAAPDHCFGFREVVKGIMIPQTNMWT